MDTKCRLTKTDTLNLAVTCPGYDADVADNVPYIDIAGVHDDVAGTISFFAVNRHGTDTLPTEISLQGFGAATVIDHQVMTHSMLNAVNTAENQANVGPQKGKGAKIEDGAVNLWKWGEWDTPQNVATSGGKATALAFSPDGEILAIGVDEQKAQRQICLHQTSDCKLAHSWPAHAGSRSR